MNKGELGKLPARKSYPSSTDPRAGRRLDTIPRGGDTVHVSVSPHRDCIPHHVRRSQPGGSNMNSSQEARAKTNRVRGNDTNEKRRRKKKVGAKAPALVSEGIRPSPALMDKNALVEDRESMPPRALTAAGAATSSGKLMTKDDKDTKQVSVLPSRDFIPQHGRRYRHQQDGDVVNSSQEVRARITSRSRSAAQEDKRRRKKQEGEHSLALATEGFPPSSPLTNKEDDEDANKLPPTVIPITGAAASSGPSSPQGRTKTSKARRNDQESGKRRKKKVDKHRLALAPEVLLTSSVPPAKRLGAKKSGEENEHIATHPQHGRRYRQQRDGDVMDSSQEARANTSRARSAAQEEKRRRKKKEGEHSLAFATEVFPPSSPLTNKEDDEDPNKLPPTVIPITGAAASSGPSSPQGRTKTSKARRNDQESGKRRKKKVDKHRLALAPEVLLTSSVPPAKRSGAKKSGEENKHITTETGDSSKGELEYSSPTPAPFRSQDELSNDVEEENIIYPGAVHVNNRTVADHRSESTILGSVPELSRTANENFHLVDAERVEEQEEANTPPPLAVAERVDSAIPRQGSRRVRFLGIGVVGLLVAVIIVFVVVFTRTPSFSGARSSAVKIYGREWDPQTTTEINRNFFTGTIPAALGKLTQLTRLKVDSKSLVGSIPRELGRLTQLTLLDLSLNDLTGSIPVEIGQLTRLTELNLIRNFLTGSIPAEIGQLTQVTDMGLCCCLLTGTIPTEIGQLRRLVLLRLDRNSLSGPVPTNALANLFNLNSLWLQLNDLWGEIPSSLCSFDIELGIRIDCGEIACDCCRPSDESKCP